MLLREIERHADEHHERDDDEALRIAQRSRDAAREEQNDDERLAQPGEEIDDGASAARLKLAAAMTSEPGPRLRAR
jgi:hypothetical protein